MKRLTVVSVGYPFALVSADSVGGAEQVLAAIDGALVAAGHRSIVIAQEGSRTAGTLVPIARHDGELDPRAVGRAHAAVITSLAEVIAREHVDVVHLHGIDFDQYVPLPGPPVVATLHLPPPWYSRSALRPTRPSTFLCCVSEAQRRGMPRWAARAEVIENGVPIDALRFRARKAGYCLVLARLSPEKAVHEAIDAADEAGVPLVIAGEVSSWHAHRRYFEEVIRPRLRPAHRFLGPVGFARKRRLLAGARALLVPSRVPETSSLVCMEALASGTPVIAYPSGALPSLVDEGVTGFVVPDHHAMAEAIRRSGEIAPGACLRAATERFSREGMTSRYLGLYERLAADTKRATSRRPLEIGEVSGVRELAAIAPEWEALADRCPTATPFQLPGWLLAYAHAFCGETTRAEPWALVARRGGNVVGLAPLCTRREGASTKTTLLGDGVSDYLDVLVDPEAGEETVASLAESLAARSRGQAIVLDEIRECSPLLGIAGAVFQRKLVPCPVLRLVHGIDPLPPAMRENVRQCHRRAERLGRVTLVDVTGAGVAEALELVFALHRSRWEERGEPGVFAREEVRAFHREAIPALARRGSARVYLLRIGGATAAGMLVLRDDWSDYDYIGGFDPAFGSVSPGTLVLAHAIERASADGRAEVDLLRGAESYKYRFGAVDRWNRECRLDAAGEPAKARSRSASAASLAQRPHVQQNPRRS